MNLDLPANEKRITDNKSHSGLLSFVKNRIKEKHIQFIMMDYFWGSQTVVRLPSSGMRDVAEGK